jgi:hypothetical protein
VQVARRAAPAEPTRPTAMRRSVRSPSLSPSLYPPLFAARFPFFFSRHRQTVIYRLAIS